MFKVVLSGLPLIARILISFLFVFAALSNINHAKQLITDISQKAVPLASMVFYFGVSVELISGLCLMVGYKVNLAIPVLVIFIILATLLFHDFWHAEGEFYRVQCLSFVTNLSTIGALLLLMAWYAK